VSAIELYTLAKENHFDKRNLARAFAAVTDFEISQTMVDVLFVMLDRNDDGVLDSEELVTALRRHKLNTRLPTTSTWQCVRHCFGAHA
jgi:Ca2+-binding EF-hand superfamily protein